MKNPNRKKNPWSWIPTLYFAEGLPYVVVMSVAVLLYKRLGISNAEIALWTSWLYLPWVIKPIWSPIVDLFRTKRWWIVTMQMLIGAGLGGVAFTIPVPFFFQATLAFFWLLAFSSATHDIAADGFYMLALDEKDQAFYVGIRSTFYRIASVTGQGLLIILAGWLETATGLDPVHFEANASPETAHVVVLPDPDQTFEAAEGDLRFVLDDQTPQIATRPAENKAARLLAFAREQNERHGFVAAEAPATVADDPAQEQPTNALGVWLRRTFHHGSPAEEVSTGPAGTVLVGIRLSKAPVEGKQVVLNTAFKRGDKSIALVHGERLVFTSDNWNRNAYLVVRADPKLQSAATAEFSGTSGNIPLAWSLTFFVMAGLFIAFTVYHKFALPRPASDKRVGSGGSVKAILHEFLETFASFFRKPHILPALAFMLLYRLPEAQLIKLITPFLVDARELGGLGLTTGQVGMVYGTMGVIGLTVGGIIGGIAAAHGGLKRWLWPMALSISLTCATFVYLGYFQPEHLLTVYICVFIEQFGYGFGFTAYMLYLMQFSEGEHKTAHYAICTGFMALGMMLPGMSAGWLQEMVGYESFFIWVMICTIPSFIAVRLIRVR